MGPLSDHSEETFAQGLAYGFTAMSAAEEAGLSVTAIEASHLSSQPHIIARVNELVATQSFDMSNEHLRVARQLEQDRDFAYRLGNPGAAINATVQRAKVLGVFVERFDTNQNIAVSNPNQLTPEEWAARHAPALPSAVET